MPRVVLQLFKSCAKRDQAFKTASQTPGSKVRLANGGWLLGTLVFYHRIRECRDYQDKR